MGRAGSKVKVANVKFSKKLVNMITPEWVLGFEPNLRYRDGIHEKSETEIIVLDRKNVPIPYAKDLKKSLSYPYNIQRDYMINFY